MTQEELRKEVRKIIYKEIHATIKRELWDKPLPNDIPTHLLLLSYEELERILMEFKVKAGTG